LYVAFLFRQHLISTSKCAVHMYDTHTEVDLWLTPRQPRQLKALTSFSSTNYYT